MLDLDWWLSQVFAGEHFLILPASSDASFRRYYRIDLDGQTYIVMDAPPQHEELGPFIHVAALFAEAGVNVPKILAENRELGFLLLTDLGQDTYLDRLEEATADALYRDANEALIKIQLASRPGELPDYDEALLLREMRLFSEWYVPRQLGVTLSPQQQSVLEASFQLILRRVLAQPRVYVHRDYHSRNLMVCDPNPGILDFQDAVYGPITYDLVSLYKDAYIAWDEEQILDWVIRYWERARREGLPVATDFGEFYRDFEWMGVQRHLKVLGIFARLWHRDGKEAYLESVPLVLNYLRRTCERYGELGPLLQLLDELHGSQPQVGYTF
ncbi:aminoglycoside phosphotransferase family protein [Thiobacter aerophilum]|uniref:Phosphotransferase n=1 Tax=Thiobacter aerophilum TaxID=3121275 RepID=A0ABV0EHW4_9BURK